MLNSNDLLTLRDLRERAELSQEDVAEALGVSQPMVHYWEHGKTGVRLETRKALAKLYQRSPEEITAAIIATRKGNL